MKRYIQDKGKSDCRAVTYPGGLFTLWAVADATLSFLGASGDYSYLICIFIAESTENMVHPG
ncbi:hypothetical protein LD628_22725, partial [Salmonella enterica]|nr:hypothetical protein [Salmonella enterica]